MVHGTRFSLPGVCPFLLAVLLAVSTSGCGKVDDGPTRYNVSGNVTFDGQPIPDGMIVFEHAESKIKTACPIVEGSYENESGKGHLGGKYTVSIGGCKSPPVAGMNGPELFQGRWTKEVELPAESTSMDFDIPASEVKAAPAASTNPADQS
ncbi:MAG: hypothetical protein AB7U20_21485 [Planctomycetaceae bacterium]